MHDIGKNIVGVVLACNGFDVIDLGVMVPAHRILDTAVERDADLIGLSGLITPSLDEMCARRDRDGAPRTHAAAADRRRHDEQGPHRGQDRPLLPRGQTVYVPDASRAVGVAGALVSEERRPALVARSRAEYARDRRAPRAGRDVAPCHARGRPGEPRPIDWQASRRRGRRLGVEAFPDYDLGELVRYIDWTPFFHTWELSGTFPAILDDPTSAPWPASCTATRSGCSTESSASAGSGRGGRRPLAGERDGDDIAVFADERAGVDRDPAHAAPAARPRRRAPNHALADFVGAAGVPDHVGAFAVTDRPGEREHVERFEREHDDYGAILFKALCDRLAEAFAERMHERVRRELWGYAPDERCTRRADRRALPRNPPGAGYGCQPDHTEKRTIFALLDAPARAGIELTESCAMLPGLVGLRALPLPPAGALLRRRADRRRPARGLRRAQGLGARRGAALARADPGPGVAAGPRT